jgi:hypothetical protein
MPQRPEDERHTIEAGSIGGLIRAVLRFGRKNPGWEAFGECWKEGTPQGSRWRQQMLKKEG